VVKSSPRFAVKRVFFSYGMDAHFLVDIGVDPYRIDYVIKGFGMPMGPFSIDFHFEPLAIFLHSISKQWHSSICIDVFSGWQILVVFKLVF